MLIYDLKLKNSRENNRTIKRDNGDMIVRLMNKNLSAVLFLSLKHRSQTSVSNIG